LIEAQIRAFRKFYLRPKIFFKLLKLIDHKQIFYLMKRLNFY